MSSGNKCGACDSIMNFELPYLEINYYEENVIAPSETVKEFRVKHTNYFCSEECFRNWANKSND